jgi:hypothetical protein
MACRQFIEEGVNEKLHDPLTAKVLTDLLSMIHSRGISEQYVETLVGKSFRSNRYTIPLSLIRRRKRTTKPLPF